MIVGGVFKRVFYFLSRQENFLSDFYLNLLLISILELKNPQVNPPEMLLGT